MTPKTALVIGANRGIGLQFVKTLKERGWSVIGSIRPENRGDPSIAELVDTGARIVEIDYKKEDTIIQAAKELDDTKLDLLVNVAGIAVQPPSWENHYRDDLLERFNVMAVGPFLAIRHFLPHVEQDGGGKIVNISSISGSIAANDDERFIGYKVAKAALNQVTVTLANEFKKKESPVIIMALQPGHIQTRLSRFTGSVDIVQSLNGMADVIERLTPEDSPSFYNWKGEKLPW